MNTEIDWEHKYRSKVSEFGAYKTKVQRDVLNRETIVKWKEERLKKKEEFLKNTDFEKLKSKEEELNQLQNKIYNKERENRNELERKFNEQKEKIIQQLSDEVIRTTENFDFDEEKTRGYVIGLNKAKKIINENMKFYLSTPTERIIRLLDENN